MKDLTWEQKSSMPSMLPVEVTPLAPACVLRLTVLNETSSDGHRVKLEGVMVQSSTDTGSMDWLLKFV